MKQSQMLKMPKHAIWLCFHNELLTSTLETQIKANEAFANAQHAEKRVFALFSPFSYEICSRNANKGTCSCHEC